MTAALHPLEPALAPDRARRGGRAGKRAGGSAAFEQPAFRQLKNPLAPTRLVSEDELESIHLASLRVLREIGVDVLHDEARRIMQLWVAHNPTRHCFVAAEGPVVLFDYFSCEHLSDHSGMAFWKSASLCLCCRSRKPSSSP